MNLQQLRYVIALAEVQSFTKAAEGLFVVQSALSQQVRKLEDELGVQLFERTTRSVSLTPAGESLLPLFQQVLAGVDQIKIDAQAMSGIIAGRLTVGIMEVPSENLDVAALMATFHARYPDVRVTLRSGGSDLLVNAIRDRKLDVAIVGSNAVAAGQLVFIPLFVEPLVAVLSAQQPLATQSSVSLRELADLPFIDFPPGYGLRHETDRGFTHLPRGVAFEVTRVEEVIQFARKNLGVALLPESVARSRADGDRDLAILPLRNADLHRQVHLVTPAGAGSAACRAFVRCVTEHVGQGTR
ncbi:LysR family transcriptional regulator [Mycobacterium talmoniae]|uniref:Probable hydrogen peroxide-inducible genes activator n=1 Tax=Mycobacterium talmoniae TaxID=1858794 RepID=A0A1S1NJ22_9MYCO|nr:MULTISPECIES: LysR family transcriptional regulator [Mycobacterium]OHV03830.1 LysR family transcriptional regulator [Mycobacterium talmoniae]PQM45470.1 HTH-type transcriptional regulator GltC [Mycobacterium talmoniae]TDH52455.1 LysR family transcriptional regulator [Mycobacterium eburneum]